MADKLLDQFRQRYNRAQQISYLWASLHEACYFYAIPNRNRYWRPKEQQGETKGTRVYDTTAVEGVKTFVSKLETVLMRNGIFVMDDGRLSENKKRGIKIGSKKKK